MKAFDYPHIDVDGDDICPACGAQAHLICDDWSEQGTIQYFFECADRVRVNGCNWKSRTLTESELPEKWRSKTL